MRFEHFAEIDSTSAELGRRANAGDIEPVWVQADVQMAGVGRRGREWTSARGNLFCSGLYPITGDIGQAALLSYAAALATAQLCGAYVDPKKVTIKWPNDIHVEGAKVAGILLESGHGPAGPWITVGVGVNLLSSPSDTPYPATNLAAHISSDDPEDIPNAMSALAILARHFEDWRNIFLRDGFEPIRAAWLQRASGMGQMVTANLAGRQVIGTMIGLSNEGELEVRLPDGAVTLLSSGEIFFGGANATRD